MDWKDEKKLLTETFGKVIILADEESGQVSAYVPNLFHVKEDAEPGPKNYLPHHIIGSSLTVSLAIKDLFDHVTWPKPGMSLMHKSHDNPHLYAYDRDTQEFSQIKSL